MSITYFVYGWVFRDQFNKLVVSTPGEQRLSGISKTLLVGPSRPVIRCYMHIPWRSDISFSLQVVRAIAVVSRSISANVRPMTSTSLCKVIVDPGLPKHRTFHVTR